MSNYRILCYMVSHLHMHASNNEYYEGHNEQIKIDSQLTNSTSFNNST